MNSDKNGIVQLKIDDSGLHTYSHIAYLFAILLNEEKTYTWIYSNFIQVYMNKNLYDNRWGDFYFPMPYEAKPVDFCKWIKTSRTRREEFQENSVKLMEFVKKEICFGHYIHLVVNHYYLQNDENYMRNRSHDTLIYGINESEQVVCLLDTMFKGSLNKITVSYENFIKAYYDYEINQNMNSFDEMIFSYSLKEESTYQFDARNIENSIIDYYHGQLPEYWRLFNNENRENIIFGINVYDALVDYAKRVKEIEYQNFDARQFYLMYEHKKIMIDRFRYLGDHWLCSKECAEHMILSYETLMEKSESLINIILKYNITNNIESITKIMDITLDIKNKEKIILEKYINDFTENQVC